MTVYRPATVGAAGRGGMGRPNSWYRAATGTRAVPPVVIVGSSPRAAARYAVR